MTGPNAKPLSYAEIVQRDQGSSLAGCVMTPAELAALNTRAVESQPPIPEQDFFVRAVPRSALPPQAVPALSRLTPESSAAQRWNRRAANHRERT